MERIVSWIARRTVTRLNLPKSAANNIIIIFVRLILIVTGVTAALPLFGVFIPSELLVALTASLATAFALFLSFSLENVVAGIYILITQPFSVGDYVRIGDNEGIVEEVTINYTRLYGPDRSFVTLANQRVLLNSIINYRVKETIHAELEPEKAEEKELEAQTEKPGRVRRLFSRRKIGEVRPIKLKALYRYTFTVNVRRDYFDEDKIEQRFEEVCRKWEPKFRYKPSYQPWGAGGGDVPYLFSITMEEPIKLIEFRNDFYKDIIRITGPTKR
ncbi:MAG: mechanosensitive ion channel domain-containing protein [Candidatus Freyarchaeota archaeon]